MNVYAETIGKSLLKTPNIADIRYQVLDSTVITD